jgi:hypothetical protein
MQPAGIAAGLDLTHRVGARFYRLLRECVYIYTYSYTVFIFFIIICRINKLHVVLYYGLRRSSTLQKINEGEGKEKKEKSRKREPIEDSCAWGPTPSTKLVGPPGGDNFFFPFAGRPSIPLLLLPPRATCCFPICCCCSPGRDDSSSSSPFASRRTTPPPPPPIASCSATQPTSQAPQRIGFHSNPTAAPRRAAPAGAGEGRPRPTQGLHRFRR